MHSSNLPPAHSRHIFCSFTSCILPVTRCNFEQFFDIMSTFHVITRGFLSKLAKLISQLMQPIVTLLKNYVMLFLLNYKLS